MLAKQKINFLKKQRVFRIIRKIITTKLELRNSKTNRNKLNNEYPHKKNTIKKVLKILIFMKITPN